MSGTTESHFLTARLMHECTHCKLNKPTREYLKDTRYTNGHRNTCNRCRTKQVLNCQRKKKYGMGTVEYEEFFKKHNHSCDVCGAEDRLGVDHCHTSGAARGLLCSRCNTALGMVNDDIEVLEGLVGYLSYS